MAAARKADGTYQKGISGNPGGRPKNDYAERRLREMRRLVTSDDWKKIVLTAISRAKAGEKASREWLSDYLLGKPLQRTEISGEGGDALRVIVEYVNGSDTTA